MNFLRTLIVSLVFMSITACSDNNPGVLEGTWKGEGLMVFDTTFREDEVEIMGTIEKVSYRKDGENVLVTYESGQSKGSTIRFNIIDNDTIQSPFVKYKRLKVND